MCLLCGVVSSGVGNTFLWRMSVVVVRSMSLWRRILFSLSWCLSLWSSVCRTGRSLLLQVTGFWCGKCLFLGKCFLFSRILLLLGISLWCGNVSLSLESVCCLWNVLLWRIVLLSLSYSGKCPLFLEDFLYWEKWFILERKFLRWVCIIYYSGSSSKFCVNNSLLTRGSLHYETPDSP